MNLIWLSSEQLADLSVPTVSPTIHSLVVVAAFVFGTIIGSFLNACVYRIPREVSLLNPVRSFCPTCRHTIRWFENIPVLAWFFLHGRCAHCHSPIRPLYVVIELVTGVLFAISAWRIPFPTTFPIWVLISLLVIATFVDFDFLVIPNSITKGGIAIGLILSILTPELHGTSSRVGALALSAIGVTVGAGILYLVSELGKLAFGQYKIALEKPVSFTFENLSPDDARIIIDRQIFYWKEHFYRKSDKITLRATETEIDGTRYQSVDLIFFYNRLVVANQTLQLEQLHNVTGQTAHAELPREAMGLGDVKLIGAIGAFVGWQGVLFTIPAAAFIGVTYGLLTSIFGKREWSAKIPFGPYLAAGSLLWLFQGHEIIAWYQRLLDR